MSGYQPDGLIDEFTTAGGTDAADEFAAVLAVALAFLLAPAFANDFSDAFLAGITAAGGGAALCRANYASSIRAGGECPDLSVAP